MEKFTVHTFTGKAMSYYELDHNWSAREQAKLVVHLSRVQRYLTIFSRNAVELTTKEFRFEYDWYLANHKDEASEIKPYKNSMARMVGVTGEEFNKRFVSVYRVPIKKYENTPIILTKDQIAVVIPEEAKATIDAKANVGLYVALTRDGEFKTYLSVVTETPESEVHEPLKDARYQLINVLNHTVEVAPEIAKIEIDSLIEMLNTIKGEMK